MKAIRTGVGSIMDEDQRSGIIQETGHSYGMQQVVELIFTAIHKLQVLIEGARPNRLAPSFIIYLLLELLIFIQLNFGPLYLQEAEANTKFYSLTQLPRLPNRVSRLASSSVPSIIRVPPLIPQ